MNRYEGFGFAIAYGLYVTYLIWSSSGTGAPSWFTNSIWFVLIPIAVVVVLGTAWRDRHQPLPEDALH